MEMLIEIKQIREDEADILTSISRNTFIDAFSESNTEANMNAYLDENMNNVKIKNELIDKLNIFYGAYVNGAMVGYCKLSKNIPPREVSILPAIELERLYVLRLHQNGKIGAGLMRSCIDYAVTHGYRGLWLGVWEHNNKAIQFYKRWGYEIFGSHIFMVGNDAQTDIWMIRKLG
ncbi:MAG: GNAT family N-acetyltransferase [Flavipsychrobacter sp.]|nr:GNAT family N-acetyltransferase [Flavipsychrobacter sp.]